MSEPRVNMPILSVEKTIKHLSNIYCEIVKKGISPKVLPSVMLWGPPGVGKSQAIRQIAKDIKKNTGKETKITDVRLLLFNPIDIEPHSRKIISQYPAIHNYFSKNTVFLSYKFYVFRNNWFF